MKKLCLLPVLLVILLAALCLSASAATIDGQVSIASVYDAYGQVTTLTDDQTHTTWSQQASGDVDLTLNLYGATVGEIWIRSGHCYSQNYYNSYDRPSVIKVSVWYRANQYTTTCDSYRYRLSDSYRPNSFSSSWNGGYQRILLPKSYSGVTKIELTIESTVTGYRSTGATISDIIVACGSHATATPRAYNTATPKPYVVYVTPTPNFSEPDDGYVDYITPPSATNTPTRDVIVVTRRPTETPLVEYITPRPTKTPLVEYITPRPTKTPLVELITPTPGPAIGYPTETGILATLTQRLATRTGPGTGYDEPGSFFSPGTKVNVVSKAWDDENEIWWFQVEFQYKDAWYRAYTPAERVDLNPDLVLTENMERERHHALYNQRVRFGPGEEYEQFKMSILYEGAVVSVYSYEVNPITNVVWAQVEYHCYVIDQTRRAWIPAEVLDGWTGL